MFFDIAVKIFSWIIPEHENLTTRNIITRKFDNTKISQYTVVCTSSITVQIDSTYFMVILGTYMTCACTVESCLRQLMRSCWFIATQHG